MRVRTTAMWLLLVALWGPLGVAGEEGVTQCLQEVSVTIKAGISGSTAQGSGVIVTREVPIKPDSQERVRVSFVWTAAHVIDDLRSTREVVDPETGQKRTAIQFQDAAIVQELVERGRRVGELKIDAKVIRYSDAEDGEDLALLMIRKRDFVSSSAKFHEADSIPTGTRLYHVGSLLGQLGANSLTSGILSQVGRVLEVGHGEGVVFDQTTCAAFPGSSGGGVFLAEGESAGACVGLIVRGAGETFNLMVPVRRIRAWAQEVGVEWAMDERVAPPDLQTLEQQPIEDPGVQFRSK